MRKLYTLFLGGLLLISGQLAAKVHDSSSRSSKTADQQRGRAANCAQGLAKAELNLNNVKALLLTGGDMWKDFGDKPSYEIPKGSEINALFAGGLWMAGEDESGQLRVAAQTFRDQGNDFWPGPLNTATTDIDPQTCLDYDKHFKSTRAEVAQFAAWFEAGDERDTKFPDYQIPDFILEWPGNGNPLNNEDQILAPFFDQNGDGFYNPVEDGDYPKYDLKNEQDCSSRDPYIYGDQNLWWIFNDKGNVHTQSNAAAIGLEIRAQAFAFASNDEVNNMTFYNYEIINWSSFNLTNAYFGQWVDVDLGNFDDDFVGCDVSRGLGFAYNGDDFDDDHRNGKGYGQRPPAIGIDFFQGPFQDNDGIDNPGPLRNDSNLSYRDAFSNDGIPYKGLGVGYGDSIVDNERMGMFAFLYHNSTGCQNQADPRGDPCSGQDYYGYLRSLWKDGSKMVYGGTGHKNNCSAPWSCMETDYMFPDDSDPVGWGVGGDQTQDPWNEANSGNDPLDRRFLQSAGPFTLKAGAKNFITVGVVWARATSGNNLSSIEAMKKADDKTQSLFDNCFQILTGPDAPLLTIQELDQELIIYITNPATSNNINDTYEQIDPSLIPPDSLSAEEKKAYSTYYFQGYQIYQIKDHTVTAENLDDPDKARLVAQCDIKDGVSTIINHPFDSEIGFSVPKLMVDGEDKGVFHSVRITEDEFASGDRRLVNHKKVYYMAIAYAYNHSPFNEFDPNDPEKLNGQKFPYLPSRTSSTGGAIEFVSAIPHKPVVEKEGTIANSKYGDGVEVTRIQGQGNGGLWLEMKQESIDEIMSGEPWKVENPVYEAGNGPISVKIIDPLNVPSGTFHLRFKDTLDADNLTSAYWSLIHGNTEITSDKTIEIANEQLVPEWGISISIGQVDPIQTSDEAPDTYANSLLGGDRIFSNPGNQWLAGIEDEDATVAKNWIRSGLFDPEEDPNTPETERDFIDHLGMDDLEVYEGIVSGTIAPFRLSAVTPHGPQLSFGPIQEYNRLSYLPSVDIVFTSDKSKWTRCPVVETQEDETLSEKNGFKGLMRQTLSVDKNGVPFDTTGMFTSSDTWEDVKRKLATLSSTNPDDANYVGAFGMGWFPGYAINLETGERLNMAFGEDSWLGKDNGRDMIWNPTEFENDELFANTNIRFGGKHFIYVFRNNVVEDLLDQNDPRLNASSVASRMPYYDAGAFAHKILLDTIAGETKIERGLRILPVWRSTAWVGFPRLEEGSTLLSVEEGLIPSSVTVKVRVAKPYAKYAPGTALDAGQTLAQDGYYYVDKGPIEYNGKTYIHDEVFVAKAGETFTSIGETDEKDSIANVIPILNKGLPYYTFSTSDLAVKTQRRDTATDALKLVNVVPNPYYAFSEYEGTLVNGISTRAKLDNRVRIINLPDQCEITIYTSNGTVVRRFSKDDPTITSVDWDLKNEVGLPISSGLYIIHVNAPNIGERVVKWMGMMRPIDLDSF